MFTDISRMNWHKTRGIIKGIIGRKCPACQKGDYFKHKHGYRLKEMGHFQDECKECGQRFRIEPGFYFGAAYVSYGINVGVMIVCAALVSLFFENPTLWNYVILIFTVTLLGFPIIFRLSRLIWAYLFIPKKKDFNAETGL